MMSKKFRTYFKFLSKNKVYTVVSVFGFSVSLMFVILLGLYTQQELSVDSFHAKKDRIYLMSHDYQSTFGNTVAPFVKDKHPEIEAFCRAHSRSVAIGAKGTDKMQAKCIFVDSTFFNMFSFKLIEGNASQVLQAQKSVVVTQNFANKTFLNEDPIGKILVIDEQEHIVTGIMENMPYNTHFPECDFIATYSSITTYWGGGSWILDRSDNFGFPIYLLVKENSNFTTKLPLLVEQFKEEFWFYKNGFTDKVELTPLEDIYFNIKDAGYLQIKTNSRRMIEIYIAIAILILIVATLNYVNMTVAQAGFRGKEAAIKKLLGSSKSSIVLQLLGESFIMTLLAWCIGLIFAIGAEPFFNELLTTKIDLMAQLSATHIVIMILFVALVSCLAGIIPALAIASFSPLEIVKGTFSKKMKTSYSKVLMIFQCIVTISLLIISIVIKQQSDYLVNYDLGYKQDNIFTMRVGMDTTQTEGFKNKILAIAGVDKVSFSCGTPMDQGNNSSFEKDGQQYSTQHLIVDNDFLNLYGITAESTMPPMIKETLYINKALEDSPLADKKNMTIDLGWENKRQYTGVLNDFHFGSLHNERRYMYISVVSDKIYPWNLSVKINANADLFTIANKIQKEYTSYTGGKLPEDPQFVNNIVQDWYKKEQSQSRIIAIFTLLTIIISIMGVFAMSMYMIKQKEKEIGIRKVNGSTEGQILLMLNKDTQKRVLIGFAIACPIAYYSVTRWLEDFSYRIQLEWWIFALPGIIISTLTLLAVSYLTWKAAKSNPIEILKKD